MLLTSVPVIYDDYKLHTLVKTQLVFYILTSKTMFNIYILMSITFRNFLE